MYYSMFWKLKFFLLFSLGKKIMFSKNQMLAKMITVLFRFEFYSFSIIVSLINNQLGFLLLKLFRASFN